MPVQERNEIPSPSRVWESFPELLAHKTCGYSFEHSGAPSLAYIIPRHTHLSPSKSSQEVSNPWCPDASNTYSQLNFFYYRLGDSHASVYRSLLSCPMIPLTTVHKQRTRPLVRNLMREQIPRVACSLN